MRRFATAAIAFAMTGTAHFSTGCVERTLQVESEPSGALVYLNGQEVGRTPMRKNFVYYGTYDLQMRKPGYETLTATPKVWAGIWQVPPIDFVAELLPFPIVDSYRLRYPLTPIDQTAVAPEDLVNRGLAMRGQLEGSPSKGTRK